MDMTVLLLAFLFACVLNQMKDEIYTNKAHYEASIPPKKKPEKTLIHKHFTLIFSFFSMTLTERQAQVLLTQTTIKQVVPHLTRSGLAKLTSSYGQSHCVPSFTT